MKARDWLNRGVLLQVTEKTPGKEASAPGSAALQSPKTIVPALAATAPEVLPAGRSTRERLNATLRQKEEALSPRILRRTLEELKAIVDPRVSEVEGGRRAKSVAGWYAAAPLNERRDMCC